MVEQESSPRRRNPIRSRNGAPRTTTGPAQYKLVEEFKIRFWTWAASSLLYIMRLTIRKSYIGHTKDLRERWRCNDRVIMTFWHSRILLMRFAYQGRKACVMNSMHRDGEIVTRVMERFGILSVRGSSSRGWTHGLKGLVNSHGQGYDLIVVPDGPRGPSRRAKTGALQIARVTGAPVYPTAYSARWHFTINSWDKLMIPLPFSRVVFVVGRPIYVPTDADSSQMAEKRRQLEIALSAATKEADSHFRQR